MPANVTKARKDITQAFGTELVYSDPMEGSDGAIKRRAEAGRARIPIAISTPTSTPTRRIPSPTTTAPGVEILDALGDRITHFVAGLGTSGTVMGTTRRLHEHTRPVHCVAVEPAEALHGLEGLKHMESSIVPAIFDPSVPDEILRVGTEDGWDMADRVAAEEGLHVGHSTGANIFAAVKLAERLSQEGRGGCVVTVACDRGDRYFAPMKWERRYTW